MLRRDFVRAMALLGSLSVGTLATAQTATLQIGAGAAAVGDPVGVPILLDTSVDTAGFSFGVCHDPAALQLLSVDLGSDLTSMNGGAGPEFVSLNPYPTSGFTTGVIFDFAGIQILPPGSGYELLIAHYVVLAEGASTLAMCDTLGSPPVATIISIPGGATQPLQAGDGTVTGIPAAGTFRRGDLDGNGTRDEIDYGLLREWLFAAGAPFVGVDPPVGCDLMPNQSGDINDNEVETIADLLMFREWLDCGVIAVPEPSDACGSDPDDETDGFETPDSDYLISAFTISITGAVDAERDVEIFLQILSPTTVKAVALGLDLGSQLSPAPIPLTVDVGVSADLFDSAFDGASLFVAAASTQCATPMMGSGLVFQPFGTLHLKLAPFAIFPPAQWNGEVLIDGRVRRTTIVDEAFQDHNPFTLAGSFQFARGNANNLDALVDIADPIYTLGYLFPGVGGPLPIGCGDAADANNDGMIDIADPIYILSFLFAGGSVIPAPFPECGYDLDLDLLGCADAVCP